MVEIYLPKIAIYPERIMPSYRVLYPAYIRQYAPVPPKVTAIARKRLREYAYAIKNIKERYRKALKQHADLLRELRKEFAPTPPFLKKALEKAKKTIKKIGAGIKTGVQKTVGWARRTASRLENAIKTSWKKTSRYLGELYKKAREGARRIAAIGTGLAKKAAAGVGKVVGTIKKKVGETWNWLVSKAKASKEYLKKQAERLRAEGKEKEAQMLEASMEQLTEPGEVVLQTAATELEEAKQKEIEAKRKNWIIPTAIIGGLLILIGIIMFTKK